MECRIDVGDPRSVGVSVFASGGGGIPKWIRPRKKGSGVVAKLPQDWYKDGDLLGFVLYSIYDPVLDNETEVRRRMKFKCELSFLGHERQLVAANVSINFPCDCYI